MNCVRYHLAAPNSLTSLLAKGRVALFLDFDGTLIEIAEKPDAVTVARQLPASLSCLSERLGGALGLVTGRSIDDLVRLLDHPLVYLAGSHGGDVRAPDGVTLRKGKPLPLPVAKALEDFAKASGLLYERKAHGGALHYRAHPDLEHSAHEYAAGLAEAHGLAIKSGKCVVELVWPGADKGGAVELLMLQPDFAGALPIFVGDDVTDEDGFAACQRLGGFGIAVGDRPSSAARFSLATVKDVFAWLEI